MGSECVAPRMKQKRHVFYNFDYFVFVARLLQFLLFCRLGVFYVKFTLNPFPNTLTPGPANSLNFYNMIVPLFDNLKNQSGF